MFTQNMKYFVTKFVTFALSLNFVGKKEIIWTELLNQILMPVFTALRYGVKIVMIDPGLQ
jgi:hypothetical protein